MKTRNIIWAALLAGLLVQPAFAADAPAAKAKAAEVKADTTAPKAETLDALSAPVTKYEISIDPKIVKDREFVAKLGAKIESSEVFKASECGRVDVKKKGRLIYSCAKVTCKTTELFSGSVMQPGVRLLAATITCPLGCKLSTTCTGGQYVTCCRIPVPAQKCPGASW